VSPLGGTGRQAEGGQASEASRGSDQDQISEGGTTPQQAEADPPRTHYVRSVPPRGDTSIFKRVASVGVVADPIADLRSETGSLISVYAQRPSPGGFAALLTDLLRPIREQAEAMDRPVAKAIRFDADRIHSLVPGFEVDPAPGYAIFVSDLDDLLVVESLTFPVADVAMVGPRPYLRPMRAAPRPLRSGVLVADRALARVFTAFGGRVEETGPPFEAESVKPNFGGFAGYEEHVVRGRAVETAQRIWKEASQHLLELHQDQPFDYLVVGAQGETVDDVARSLHPYLARLQRVVFQGNPGGLSLTHLRAQLDGFDEEVRAERDAALAGRVCDIAWSGGNAVLGLRGTLEAANIHAVDTLVVAGHFARDGVACDQCSYLGREGETCPVCESLLFHTDDVVASTMEVVIAGGGRVRQIRVASPLDGEGVGALTRFPVPV